MPHPIDIIPAKVYVHQETGHKVSVYSAHPGPGYVIAEVGWTVVNSDGTIGIGRQPWPYKTEAEAWFRQNAPPHAVLTYDRAKAASEGAQSGR
jgi:hypothetical protein